MKRLYGFITGLLLGASSVANAEELTGLEKIALSDNIIASFESSKNEKEMFNRFGRNIEFYLEKEGEKHFSVCLRDGSEFFKKEVSEEIAESIKRLYVPERFDKEFWNNTYIFDERMFKIEMLRDLNGDIKTDWKQSSEIVERAVSNLKKIGDKSQKFLKAIDLLAKHELKGDMIGAAIWYLARMGDEGYNWLEEKDGKKIVKTDFDFDSMSPELFYENILYAVKAKHETPWGRNISDDNFFEYVLPARVTQEPLRSFRRQFYLAFKPDLNRMKNPEDFLTYANNLLHGISRFRSTPFEDSSALMTLHMHGGRCEDLVNIVVGFCKSVGVPAFHVYTPAWAKMNDNHTWVGIKKKDANGKEWIFSVNAGYPDSTDPKAFIGCIAAKVYAKSPFGLEEDVTADFTSSSKLEIKSKEDFKEGDKAYLHVVNFGIPVSVASASFEEGTFNFGNIGNKTGILYLVGSNKSSFLEPRDIKDVVPPFILNEEGKTSLLYVHDENKAKKYNLDRESIGEDIELEKLYKLYFWKGGSFKFTKKIYSERVDGNKVILPNVALCERVLYRAAKDDEKGVVEDLRVQLSPERPFVIINDEVIRY